MSTKEKGALICGISEEKGETPVKARQETKKQIDQKNSNYKKISDFFSEKSTKNKSGEDIEIKEIFIPPEAGEESINKNEKDFTLKKRARPQNNNKEVISLIEENQVESNSKKKPSNGYTKSQEEEEQQIANRKKKDNRSSCSICRNGGELLLCDNCPKSFHFVCLKVKESELPEGEWFCADCV